MPDFGMLADTLITPLGHDQIGGFYFICKDPSSNYNCVNKKTGLIESVNSDAATVINYAITNIGLGGKIYLEAGTYVLSTSILLNQSSVHMIGAGNQATQLKANGNYPAMIISSKFCVVQDIYFTHNTAGYSSSLLQLLATTLNVVYHTFINLQFYDYGQNASAGGNAIELFNNAAASAAVGIIYNTFMACSTSGFANAIKFTMTNNGGNFINSNSFISCFFDNCTKGLACAGPSGSNMDADMWMQCAVQYEATNPLTVGFDFSDSCTHLYTGIINTMVWDLPAGNLSLKVGSQNNSSMSFTISGGGPWDDTRIGGTNAPALLYSRGWLAGFGALDRGWSFDHVQLSPLIRKSGTIQPAGATCKLEGNLAAHVTVGTVSSVWDTTMGVCNNFLSASSSNSNAGVISPTTGVGIGRMDGAIASRMAATLHIDSTTSGRLYFGVTSNSTLPISNTPLATTDSGVIFGFTTADSNWSIRTNNGGGGAATVSALSTPTAKDANWHTVEISWPWNGTPVMVLFDNIVTTVSTALPSASANLFFNVVAQCSTSTPRNLVLQSCSVEPAA